MENSPHNAQTYKVINDDGVELGPVSTQELHEWMAEGRIGPQTKVKQEGMTVWRTLASLKDFAPLALPFESRKAHIDTLRISKVAMISFVCGALPLLLRVFLLTAAIPLLSGFSAQNLILNVIFGICIWLPFLLPCVGVPLGVIGLIRIQLRKQQLTGRAWAIWGIVMSLLVWALLAFELLWPRPKEAEQRIDAGVCRHNMRRLADTVSSYTYKEDRFPRAAAWCDELTKAGRSATSFNCVSEPELRCAFAYNSRLDGRDRASVNPQTVLLFTSRVGWNATGGTELAAAHKHSGSNALVCLVDGSVRGVPLSELNKLQWEPSDHQTLEGLPLPAPTQRVNARP
jgi:hypothetical protein